VVAIHPALNADSGVVDSILFMALENGWLNENLKLAQLCFPGDGLAIPYHTDPGQPEKDQVIHEYVPFTVQESRKMDSGAKRTIRAGYGSLSNVVAFQIFVV